MVSIFHKIYSMQRILIHIQSRSLVASSEYYHCHWSLLWIHDPPYLGNRGSLQWRRNGRDGVSNHQPHDCLLNRLFKAQIKETSKLRVTCLCEGNSPGTGEFPAQKASNAETVSIWWRHHVVLGCRWTTGDWHRPRIMYSCCRLTTENKIVIVAWFSVWNHKHT